MRQEAAVVCAVVALGLSYTGTMANDGYPLFALADGTSVSAGDPNGFAVEPPQAVDSYDIEESPADLIEVSTPPGNNSTLLWGYEALPVSARILSYNIGPPVTPGPFCIPVASTGTPSQNGRGLAFDPLDGNLWRTHLLVPFFIGDGFIHKNTPPHLGCVPVTSIPFHDGPGGNVQDDIGAIDVDEATKHLWVAGFRPVAVQGALLSFIYKVNRNTGMVINSCAIPFRFGGVGNQTLSVFRSSDLPGSSKYLLTDAGGNVTIPNTYAVIDQADCHGGRVVTPVAEFAKMTPFGVTGIDFEWPGLLNTNGFLLFNNGDQPFATPTLHGPWLNTPAIQDISLCGYRAKFGGDGNDACPYPSIP
jgi:hypothetical protein